MTRAIRQLPPELVERIAAGEVIERPSSVVKELLENSLDAGAGRVTVEIEGGGRKTIRVSDDGEGIWWEDSDVLFRRHATGKLWEEEELERIATLGFRGEALASIGVVAEVELVSRRREEEWALRLRVLGGEREPRERTSRAPGTTVTVRRLFFNTPARQKFLRGDREEAVELTRVVTRYALAYPRVAFRLIRDGKDALQLASEEWTTRWRSVFGREAAEELLPVEWTDEGLAVRGGVSSPAHTRGTASEMVIFVNGRLIADRGLTGAARAAYHGLLPPRRFPRAILLLEVSPGEVDVNVHPAKREIRFSRPGEVRDGVRRAVGQALVRYLDPRAGVSVARENSLAALGMPRKKANGDLSREGRSGGETAALPLADAPSRLAAAEGFPLQLDRTFILDIAENGLRVYDQHTAHERILYEEALRRLGGRKGEAQELLIPTTMELTPEEEVVLEGVRDELASLGFDIRPFGPRTVLVGAYPTCLRGWDGGAGLREMVGEGAGATRPGIEDLAASFACHNAIRRGKRLTRREMITLLGELGGTESPHLCPHGRPTMVTIELTELRRRFKRD